MRMLMGYAGYSFSYTQFLVVVAVGGCVWWLRGCGWLAVRGAWPVACGVAGVCQPAQLVLVISF
jgi:uncharacterized membrane protein